MGLLKLIEALSEKKIIPIKKKSRINTRKAAKKNLRSNKDKETFKAIPAEIKDVGIFNRIEEKYIEKESKLTVPEELQSRSLVQASNSLCLKEKQKLPPLSIATGRVNEIKEVKQLKKDSDRNNLLHGTIAKLIQSKKQKVNSSFTFRRVTIT